MAALPRPDWVPDDAGPGFTTTVVPGPTAVRTVKRATAPRRRTLTIDDYAAGVLARDPTILGRAISLIESNAPAHQVQAQELLARLLPHTGRARRVGITGIPGVGKSTFIEALGCHLVDAGQRVAVLAIDPSSSLSGGSILADKIRMEQLARRRGAFIRPSPSGGSLGGVARKTREAMLVCEAAGFDVVIVETVGVGQSEVAVRSMVDFFLVLLIAGAGDEFQGLKKGVMELADALVINKADGDNRPRALAAQAEMKRVLHYLHRATEGWETPALLARSGPPPAAFLRTCRRAASTIAADGRRRWSGCTPWWPRAGARVSTPRRRCAHGCRRWRPRSPPAGCPRSPRRWSC